VRWFIAALAALAAGAVLLLTFPVLASGSSDGPGKCTSAVGLGTLGNSESCDTWGVAVSLPTAVLVFVLVAWGWRFLGLRRTSAGQMDREQPDD
jgi:hypothetical protein